MTGWLSYFVRFCLRCRLHREVYGLMADLGAEDIKVYRPEGMKRGMRQFMCDLCRKKIGL